MVGSLFSISILSVAVDMVQFDQPSSSNIRISHKSCSHRENHGGPLEEHVAAQKLFSVQIGFGIVQILPARTLVDLSDSDFEVELELNHEISFNRFCTKLKHQLQHRASKARRRLRRLKASVI